MAAASGDVVERATHLMAAGAAPDEHVAAELERAAHEAHASGALDAAAAFGRASLEATPATAGPLVRLERGHAWARYAQLAGRYAEADEALATIRAELERAAGSPGVEASALHDVHERVALVEVPTVTNLHGFVAGETAIERALGYTVDPRRRYVLHSWLVRIAAHQDLPRGLQVAERVFGDDSEHSGFERVLGSGMLLLARAVTGLPCDVDAAIRLVKATGDDDQRGELASMLVELLVWNDHPRTIEIAEQALAYQLGQGKLPAYLTDLHFLTEHLIVRGDWRRVDQNWQLMAEYSTEFPDRNLARTNHALVLAARGDADAAIQLLARARSDVDAGPFAPLFDLWVRKQAALVAHTLGLPTAADELLMVEQRYADLGVRAVRMARFRRDLVEALVAAGRLDEGARAAERLAADAEHNQVVTATADADAATAVVAASTGDHETARSLFASAIDVQRRYELNYELARTLLAAGAAARRSRQRAEGRQHLAEARQLFDSMRAVTWAQRCDDEARRLGLQHADAADVLTPTEQQIAELVASGMSNGEVANALFVSVRTVESHLSRIYRKLDIKSRAVLPRKLAALRDQ